MKIKKDKNNDPYVLDRAVDEKKKLDVAALTEKNSKFIEAVICLDSNYKKDIDENAKNDDGFDPIHDVSSASRKTCGSSKYWLTAVKNSKGDEEYKRAIFGAVIAIDVFNSTHLEASEEGRKKIAELIIKNYPNCDSLKAALKKPFTQNDKEHIISKLSIPLKSKKKEGERCNLSFASKFCSYASLVLLNGRDLYSKYDSVVSDLLPTYMYLYIGEIRDKNYYKIKTSSYEERLKVYESYSKDIGLIIDCEEVKSNGIKRETFDHIIWYSNK